MKPGILIACVVLVFVSSDVQAARSGRAAMLAAHNKWRAKVGVPRLHYSRSLAAAAQAWANKLKKQYRCEPHHSKPHGRYGENLYWASAVRWSDGRREAQKVTPRAVVDSWAAERAYYNHARNSCQPGKVCGHYTQLVWKTTRLVGCGHAVCKDSKDQIWVCRYAPPGNRIGDKPY